MILIDNTCISDDIADKHFVCDIEKCKGACCVEGDLGAPLEEDELQILEKILPIVKDYLSPEGLIAIEKQGPYIKDWEGDFSTTTIDEKECAYAVYDSHGVLKCSIEQAYLDGKIEYQKPISCHLYPIRITKYKDFEALNYDKWSICNDACKLGQELGIPIYKFLKTPLTRAYGLEWYNELCREIERK